MRFPTVFSRFKTVVPPGKIALGADGLPGVPPTSPATNLDNLLISLFYSNQGWPAHRIATSYKGPAGAVALTGQVWVHDVATSAWYEVGAPQVMTPNRITYFDVVALLSGPTTNSGLMSPTQGSIEALLVVQDAATPAGEYIFGVGADLTVLPL